MNYQAKITNSQQYDEGLLLQVFIPNVNLGALPGWVDIEIQKPNQVTPKQRKIIYAFFKEIADHHGETKERTKGTLKGMFALEKEIKEFSLSDMSKELAREFIEWILAFMFSFEIPMSPKVSALAKEVNNYLYLCLIHRKCCVCGRPGAHIHHRDPVGRGVDRTRVDHTKHRLMALCGEQHHPEVHTIGQETFNRKYRVDGIRLNQEAIEKIGIKGIYAGEEILEVEH